MNRLREDGADHLSATPTKEQKLAELVRRRESGEIGPEDFNTNQLQWLIAEDTTLTRRNLENANSALVISSDEFQRIGPFNVILAGNEHITLDPDDFPPDDVLILYPWDLGNFED